MPYCVGLQREQFEELTHRANVAQCSKASFVYYAIKRWKRGDFTIPEQDPGEKDIVPLTVWKKIDLEDWKIRCILRKHFEIPDQKIEAKLKKLNDICEELMKFYTMKPFTIEDIK